MEQPLSICQMLMWAWHSLSRSHRAQPAASGPRWCRCASEPFTLTCTKWWTQPCVCVCCQAVGALTRCTVVIGCRSAWRNTAEITSNVAFTVGELYNSSCGLRHHGRDETGAPPPTPTAAQPPQQQQCQQQQPHPQQVLPPPGQHARAGTQQGSWRRPQRASGAEQHLGVRDNPAAAAASAPAPATAQAVTPASTAGRLGTQDAGAAAAGACTAAGGAADAPLDAPSMCSRPMTPEVCCRDGQAAAAGRGPGAPSGGASAASRTCGPARGCRPGADVTGCCQVVCE